MPKTEKAGKKSNVVQWNVGITLNAAHAIDRIVAERQKTDPLATRSRVVRELLDQALAARVSA